MPKVLIVDDSTTVRNLLRGFFQGLGMPDLQCVMAENGQKALEILSGSHPDLLLTDFEMPVLDGLHLLVKMQESPILKEIPVIVVSAMSNAQRNAFEKLGYHRIVFKPIEEDKLRAYLHEIFPHWSVVAPVPA